MYWRTTATSVAASCSASAIATAVPSREDSAARLPAPPAERWVARSPSTTIAIPTSSGGMVNGSSPRRSARVECERYDEEPGQQHVQAPTQPSAMASPAVRLGPGLARKGQRRPPSRSSGRRAGRYIAITLVRAGWPCCLTGASN